MTEEKKNPFEQRFQSALLSIMTALIIAGVFAIFGMKEQLVRMDERDKNKENDIQNLRKSVDIIQTDIQTVKNRLTIIESTKN